MPETKNNPTEHENNINDTINGVLGILTRRRWWILAAACCIPVAVVAVALKLPDRYVSQATLLVVQQQVSQRYVEPDDKTTVTSAVQAMKLEVLSRGQLIKIIDDLGLYANENEHRAPELFVGRMLKDVDIQPLETSPGVSSFDAFTISFTAESSRLAQEVTSRLTSLFIEQNQKNRGEQAENTTRFLSEQLDAAKQRLTQQEQHLQAFKTANLGELPDQQQANLNALSNAREQLSTTTLSLFQAQQQRTSIESAIQSLLNERLARLQSEKTALLTRYTSQYPAVIKKEKEIGQLQALFGRVTKRVPETGTRRIPDSLDDPGLVGLIRQAEASAAELETLSNQQKKLKADAEQYQARLNLTPVREQQLAEILRDYDLFRQDYTDLLNKKLKSQLTTNLEENQEGQQFRLVDPPTLPSAPSGPPRLKICLGGMAGGILFGIALGFLIDLRDGSFHDEKMFGQTFALPVVLAMPLVLTPAERRARVWRRGFEWMAGCVMTLAMFAAEFYVFRHG